MVAKYNMSEKCIDILYYGKAELLQVYLFAHMSICLIVAQCEGGKRDTARLRFLSYFTLKVLSKDPISYSPWCKCTIRSYIEKTVGEEHR